MRPPIESAITFLPCQDLTAVRRFYGEVLGLDLALDQRCCVIYRIEGTAYWGFCDSLAPHADPSKTILTLVTPDVEAWHSHLKTKGVEVDGSPRFNEKFQITHFFATDPSGYRLEVQRFEDPRWTETAG